MSGGCVILVGMMGAGKTKTGKVLARRLRCDFADTDALIVARTGLGIPELIKRDGEAGFREVEHAVLRDLADEGRTGVVATGGGVVLSPRNRKLLRKMGKVFYLAASPKVLAKRIAKSKVRRPLLENGRDVEEVVAEILDVRHPLYVDVADAKVRVEPASMPKSDIADRILSKLRKRERPR